MNKKSKKAQRKEQIEQHKQQLPLYVSEGHWDEAMLENNSYYDVDIINKANKPIFRKIEEWEQKYAKASSWLVNALLIPQVRLQIPKRTKYEGTPDEIPSPCTV